MVAYSFALAVGLVVSAPWWLLRMATTQRYREGLWERLGAVPAALRAAVAGKKTVWVHAVSVGEVLAASRLVEELGAALGEGWIVVVSTTTRTGQALAKERFGAARVFYCPLDFAVAVRAYLRVLRPAAMVLMESEVWPRLLWECRKSAVPVVVVNARVSDRSLARGMEVRAVWGRVLRGVTLWLAQSEEDARRLVAMGVNAGRVKAVGNLKFDVRAPKANTIGEWLLGIAAGRRILIAGSTCFFGAHEEGMISDAWDGEIRNDTLLVLAPRHPERFATVERDIARFYSYRKASGGFEHHDDDSSVELVLLDTIGDLAAAYRVATLAFVGGSFVDRGGHNPLEPAQFGVPVVMGPFYENFRDIVTEMRACDGLRIVEDHEDLADTFVELLAGDKGLGLRGKSVFDAQQGATARAVAEIVQMVTL